MRNWTPREQARDETLILLFVLICATGWLPWAGVPVAVWAALPLLYVVIGVTSYQVLQRWYSADPDR